MAIKKVYVHGLPEFPDSPYLYDIETPREAFSALECTVGGFFDAVRDKNFEIVTGTTTIEEEQLYWNIPADEIHITAVAEGAGRTTKIIVGTVLIAAAIWASGGLAGLGMAIPGTGGLITTGTVALVGATMIVSALSAMPSAAYEEREVDQRASSIYQGALNTQEEGSAMPYVIAGSEGCIVGGVVISTSLDAENIS